MGFVEFFCSNVQNTLQNGFNGNEFDLNRNHYCICFFSAGVCFVGLSDSPLVQYMKHLPVESPVLTLPHL